MKAKAKDLPKIRDVEPGTLIEFPTLRTSHRYTVLKFIGHKAEIEREDGWAMGVPAQTPCRVVDTDEEDS